MSATNSEHSTRRPSISSRSETAPSVMTMNGHFASVGEEPTKAQYDRGIQVVDEDKEFKYELPYHLGLLQLAEQN
jgi:hypothetical protein